jgi:hypothetical protein
MAAKAKGEKGLSRRVANLEREVKALTRETPMPAEQRASGQAAVGRGADIAQTLEALKGRSRSDLMSDRERGPSSPLTQPRARARRR